MVGGLVLFLVAWLAASPVSAQQSMATGDGDPPPPTPPDVISRANGRTVVRAVHVDAPIKIDGNLDEEAYQLIHAISSFLQTMPRNDVPPTERTDAWVLYDDSHFYVTGRCWDSAPPEQWTANEMRRDTSQLRQNDTFGVVLDTFHDRRNGYVFYTNPLGARADQVLTDEGNPNLDWNPVWEVRTGRFDGGWTVEMSIPFKSLRYKSGAGQTWGIQLRRAIRRKNEFAHLTLLPLAIGGTQGIFRISAAPTLVGLDLPSARRNVECKPHGSPSWTTDRAAGTDNDLHGNLGGDAKYGITANLTADATVRTDFAQVEVDEQQVNLTRFALSYPEKRDFFLEGRGLFDFGRGSNTGGGGGGNSSVTPTLFYSRRIGLNRGRVIPIEAGGRLTGKVGKVGLGLMNMQTGEEQFSFTPATNFTVMRVKRDIFRRSSIGAIFTNRSKSATTTGSNQAYGADAAFSFDENVTAGAYYARTETPFLHDDNESYQGRFEYAPDRYGARVEYLKVGDNFNPEVGLVRRDNFRRSFALGRFSPRPAASKTVRKYTWEGS